MSSGNERSLLSLIQRVSNNLLGVELFLVRSPEGDLAANGFAEVGVGEIKAQTRILRSQLEQRLGNRIHEKDALDSTTCGELCVQVQTDGRRSHA